MAQSKARTVKGYLDEQHAERKTVLSKVRSVVRKNLPRGYRETINWGLISYEIPLSRYPNTYNRKPLAYVALAAQKNYYAIYLLGVYMKPGLLATLKEGFRKAGKKLDMGKSCVRFRTLEDLPLDTIGRVVAGMTPAEYIELVEKYRR